MLHLLRSYACFCQWRETLPLFHLLALSMNLTQHYDGYLADLMEVCTAFFKMAADMNRIGYHYYHVRRTAERRRLKRKRLNRS